MAYVWQQRGLAALCPGDGIERLLMAYSPHLKAILERSRQQFREGDWLSEEEFWSQFEHAKPSKGSAKHKKKKPSAATTPANEATRAR